MGGARWLSRGLGLFAASGLIWAAVLIPVQVMQARMARSFSGGGDIPPRYWRLSAIWTGFGLLATALPLANLYVMVFRPS